MRHISLHLHIQVPDDVADIAINELENKEYQLKIPCLENDQYEVSFVQAYFSYYVPEDDPEIN